MRKLLSFTTLLLLVVFLNFNFVNAAAATPPNIAAGEVFSTEEENTAAEAQAQHLAQAESFDSLPAEFQTLASYIKTKHGHSDDAKFAFFKDLNTPGKYIMVVHDASNSNGSAFHKYSMNMKRGEVKYAASSGASFQEVHTAFGHSGLSSSYTEYLNTHSASNATNDRNHIGWIHGSHIVENTTVPLDVGNNTINGHNVKGYNLGDRYAKDLKVNRDVKDFAVQHNEYYNAKGRIYDEKERDLNKRVKNATADWVVNSVPTLGDFEGFERRLAILARLKTGSNDEERLDKAIAEVDEIIDKKWFFQRPFWSNYRGNARKAGAYKQLTGKELQPTAGAVVAIGSGTTLPATPTKKPSQASPLAAVPYPTPPKPPVVHKAPLEAPKAPQKEPEKEAVQKVVDALKEKFKKEPPKAKAPAKVEEKKKLEPEPEGTEKKTSEEDSDNK